MPFLDKDQKFYDYRTSEVDGLNIFDLNKASNSDAQQILNGSNYWKTEKNTYSEIIEMTPYEYFETCARDCFDEPTEKLIQSRRSDEYTLNHLKEVIQTYKKRFPIAYIDYATHHTPSQEGLHRMMVAGDLFGWDTKFPVQIIKWVDDTRAKEEKEWKHIREIERYLDRAVDRALRYRYYNIDELKDQLRSEFESEVRYVDEFENRDFKLDLDYINDNEFLVTIDNKYHSKFNIDEVEFLQAKEDNSDDLEDIDIEDEDLSDWMKDLLKDISSNKLEEDADFTEDFLTSKRLIKQLEDKFGKDYYKKPICKEVCEYIHTLCNKCEPLTFAIGVWKLDNHFIEPISVKGHCVIRYKNKLYDYTSGQYDIYGIETSIRQPRILDFDEILSKSYRSNIYRDKDYIISVF